MITHTKKENKMLKNILVAITIAALSPAMWVSNGTAADKKPRLVLQITIDQMRGDFPMRYKDRLAQRGLRYLMDEGTHYINTHFQHADTETPVGHAALFTGTYPSSNGIVAGNWFDMDKQKVIYNCEDDRYPMIGKEPAKGKGRAPTNLLSSTIGDELVISSNRQSRVFSVSVKDRGATAVPITTMNIRTGSSSGTLKSQLTTTKTHRGIYCMMCQLICSARMMIVLSRSICLAWVPHSHIL
jgi:hypothetical protein